MVDRSAGSGAPGRAPATLIYIPGLGHDSNNGAEVVAQSIAREASRYRSDVIASRDRVPSATEGLRAVATLEAGGARLLDVTELGYREALEGLARRSDGKEGVAPSLVAQASYTLFGAWLWVTALRRHSKSGLAKFQLLLGLVTMLVLSAALLVTLVGVLATVVVQLGGGDRLPAWAVDAAPWLALTGGLVSAGMLAGWRRDLLRGAQRTQQLLRYFRDGAARATITAPVTAAVDRLRESGYAGDVHVLAYSFGTVVALDAYTTDGDTTDLIPDGVRGTTSLVTVGCPYDFVRLYFPQHFSSQRAWPTQPPIPWDNVFIPSDVFGSNCREGDDAASGPTTVMGWSVTNHPYRRRETLGFWSVLFLWAGLTKHNGYWSPEGGCWEPALLRRWGLLGDRDGDETPPPTSPVAHEAGPTAPR